MKQASGSVEISGLSTAVVVADTMTKTANVRILETEDTKGLGCMTIKIIGDVDAINVVVSTGKQIGTTNGKLTSWKVTPRPSDYVDQTSRRSESPVPPFPPKKGAQEETEAKVEIRAEAMEAAKTEEPRETGLEEIALEDVEQETETGSAEAGPEPKVEAEPVEIKLESLVETEPIRTGIVDPVEPEVPDSPETSPERPKKIAKRTTSAKSASTTRYKEN